MSDPPAGQSELFHELTSYTTDREWSDPIDDPRIVQGLVHNDLNRIPFWLKQYDDSLPALALPRDLPTTSAPATAVLAGTAGVDRAELDLPGLARLLFLSAGVVRTSERPGRTLYFRAAGSAGGLFPLEVYVAVPDGGPLPPGVHFYDAAEHALVRIGPPPSGSAPALIVTGVPWRTGWRYRERGLRHIYWDAGTLVAQQLALADSAGLAAELYTRFPDADVGELVGSDGVHEFPVAVVSLGGGQPDLVAGGPAAAGRTDSDPVEFPLITTTRRAGDRSAWGAPWARGEPVVGAHESQPLEQVVLRRGSQRRMDAGRSLPAELVRTAMAASMRGIDLPHRVVAHAVDGIDPGVYRWPDLTTPVRAGLLRDEAFRVCLDQALARDAAFIVVGAVDVHGLDDRQYREAQLAAGLVEGRLHLMVYALGASASGMTFIDSILADFLGEALDGLLFTCVGVADYRSRTGGSPGAPVSVRAVPPS